jgi:hypothetical protein
LDLTISQGGALPIGCRPATNADADVYPKRTIALFRREQCAAAAQRTHASCSGAAPGGIGPGKFSLLLRISVIVAAVFSPRVRIDPVV